MVRATWQQALSPALLLLCLSIGFAYSQVRRDTSAMYRRRSISIHSGVLVAPGVRLPDEVRGELLRQLQDIVQMPRFDQNPLSRAASAEFGRRVSYGMPDTAIRRAIVEVLVPEIRALLDIERESRAENLVREAGRVDFLTQKAREAGIVVGDLESVMRSAYICIPYVDSFKITSKPSSDKQYIETRAIIIGGAMWWRLDLASEPPQVAYILHVKASGSGLSSDRKEKAQAGRKTAIRWCLRNFAESVQDLSKTWPDFQLHKQVGAVHRGLAQLDLGRNHGIRVGEEYDFVEFTKSATGEHARTVRGFGVVTRVAEHQSELRLLWGRAERGMTAAEAPVWGKLRLGLAALPVRVGRRGSAVEQLRQPAPGMGFGFEFRSGCLPLRQIPVYPSVAIAVSAGATGVAKPSYFYGDLKLPVGLDAYVFGCELGIGVLGRVSVVDELGGGSSYSNLGYGFEPLVRLSIPVSRHLGIGIKAGYGFGEQVSEWSRGIGDERETRHGPTVHHSAGLNLELYLEERLRVGDKGGVLSRGCDCLFHGCGSLVRGCRAP